MRKIIEFYKNLNLRWKLITLFVMFGFIPNIVLFSFFFSKSIQVSQNNSFETSFAQLEQTNKLLEAYSFRLFNILNSKITNPDFQQMIIDHNKHFPSSESPILNSGINDEFIELMEREIEIDSIYLYQENGKSFLVNPNDEYDNDHIALDETWVSEFQINGLNHLLLGPHNDLQTISKARNVISYIVKAQIPWEDNGSVDSSDNSLDIYIKCNVLTFQIIDIFYNNPYEERIILTNDAGDVIFTANGSMLVDNISQVLSPNITRKDQGVSIDRVKGKDFLVTWEKTSIPEIKAILLTQNENVVSELRNLNLIGFGVFFAVSLLFFIMIIFIADRITKPIKNLEESIRSVEEGDFDKKLDVTSSDEIGMLSKHYNKMLDEIQALITEIGENYRTRQELEMLVLQSQINPHFVFNTLNSIRQIALMQGNETIADSLKLLIELLQSSIRFGQDFITIREELEQIQKYVAIQQLRYFEKFNVEFNVDESVLDYKVLKFSLQPIVENSIFHGLERKNGVGNISITITKEGSDLVYKIRDNGIGFDSKILSKLMKDLDDHYRTKGFNQIGIKNVHDRIRMFFGEEYGIHISSVKGKFTEVIVKVPVITESKNLKAFPV